jgi:hypothetical protein
MTRIVLDINDVEIENEIKSDARSKGLEVKDIILDLIRGFYIGKTKLKYLKRNPLDHSVIIQNKEVINDDFEDVKLFEHVTNTSEYARELREKAWK